MAEIEELAGLPGVSFAEEMSLKEWETLLLDNYRARYREITGEDAVLHDADPVVLCMRSTAALCAQLAELLNYRGRSQLLRYAQGAALDELAALYGLVRKEPERAVVKLRFTVSEPQAGAVAVPLGTRARTEGGVYFNTVEYGQIPAGEQSVVVKAQAEQAGTGANGLAPGAVRLMVDPIAYLRSVENVEETAGGTDAESDEELTRRVYLAPSTFSTAGPADAYEYYARAWRNDVADVKVYSPAPDLVNICFMLEGGVRPGPADEEGMTEYMRQDIPRPVCDLVTCMGPEEVGYTIDVHYTVGRSRAKTITAVQNAVEAAVEEYRAWQRVLGRDIEPLELLARLRQAGAKHCVLAAPQAAAVGKTQIARCDGCSVIFDGVEED